jgi:Ca-activated chloride channel family protein
MSFLSAELLWLLLVVPILVGAYIALLKRGKAVLNYSDTGLVRATIAPSQSLRRHLPPLLLLLAVVSLIIATARPATYAQLLSPQRTIVLAMDVSLSMAATDVLPSRLAAAQTAARTFIDQQPRDVRVGIVAFAGTAEVVQPPTANRAKLAEAIDTLRLDYHTAIGSGLIAALLTIFPDAGLERGYDIYGASFASALQPVSLNRGSETVRAPRKRVAAGSYQSAAVVLLTDGSRTMGPDPIAAAREAAALGVRVFCVGFGSSRPAHVEVDGWSMDVGFDEPSLRQIAEITRGQYFRADTAERLRGIYEELSARFVVERKEIELSALFAAAAALLTIAAALASLLWFGRAA